MTDKWGKIQGKSDLVRVSGEFELSEFELSAFYCIYIYVISYPHGFLQAFVGIPPQGKAKIRQVNPLDACKAILSVLYRNLCIFHILCISIAIGLRELSGINTFFLLYPYHNKIL